MSGQSFRIVRANHVGFGVRSVERSLSFYQGVLGFPVALRYDHTAMSESALAEFEKISGIKGLKVKVAMVALPDGQMIEMVEVLQPKGDPETHAKVNLNDIGATHFCFEAEGLNALIDAMEAWKGDEKDGEKGHFKVEGYGDVTEGPMGGGKLAIVRGPDGELLEISQLPPGGLKLA